MAGRRITEVKGSIHKHIDRTATTKGQRLDYADRLKFNVILPDTVFLDLKNSAISNNRTLSMEARTMIECALRAQKEKE